MQHAQIHGAVYERADAVESVSKGHVMCVGNIVFRSMQYELACDRSIDQPSYSAEQPLSCAVSQAAVQTLSCAVQDARHDLA